MTLLISFIDIVCSPEATQITNVVTSNRSENINLTITMFTYEAYDLLIKSISNKLITRTC